MPKTENELTASNKRMNDAYALGLDALKSKSLIQFGPTGAASLIQAEIARIRVQCDIEAHKASMEFHKSQMKTKGGK